MFKRIGLVLVVLALFSGIAFAGGVTDNNNGNKGYILVSTGENNGANSVGHWTDSSFLKGEDGKDGEQGVQGEQGKRGKRGFKGEDGQDGTDGKDGQQGVKGDTGEQGVTGQDGTNGKDGEKGDTGDVGNKGDVGEKGKTPVKNIDYFDGINGVDGLNGKDVDPSTVNNLNNRIDDNSNRISELEESQYIIGGVIRVKSTKKWDVDLFADYSTNRKMIDRSGIRFTYKFGESYMDKEITKINNRLQALEN